MCTQDAHALQKRFIQQSGSQAVPVSQPTNVIKHVYVYVRCVCVAEMFYTTIRQPSSASQPT